ncbi:N-acetylmuramoyl-L-alanine amidase [Sulfurospirillum cavolei]|uniref:N-acetylmuramoyl-L-alanine amidase n=1 Tax=Sulfurospirillum cavolei TaxID=366522 RepID=UPI0005A8E380|nr:N-acetylmuramoyl-L-alanine amidase [Sulfurospirillum cavolei]
MGKHIKTFFFFLLTCLTLYAAPNYMQQLESYDAKINQQTGNDELLRVFHGLKAVYIQAIISGDNALKKETLERLIKTAKILKLDASKYESELATMGKETKNASSATTMSKSSKPTPPPPAAEESLVGESPKVETASSSLPKPTGSFKSEPESKPSFASTTHVSSLPKTYRGKNVLQHVNSDNDEVVLEFGEEVAEKSIKVFVLKTPPTYKKIIDVPGVVLNAPIAIKTPSTLQGLKISQFSDDTIRIVLDVDQSLETYVSVLSNQLIFSLGKQPILTQKKITPPPTSKSAETTPLPSQKNPSASVKEKETPQKAPTVTTTEPLASKTTAKTNKRNKTIVIDAGHGGKDAGAIGYKQRMEKHLVLDMALQLGQELKSRGYKIYFTRQSDEFINLRDRTKVANDKNADLFISLHANAAPNEAKKLSMKGLETFFLSPDRSERSKNVAALENQSDMEEMDFYSKETFLNVLNREKIVLSNKVAIDVQSGMLKSVRKKYSVEDGGVREAPFWVLVGATMPSVLIELGYISNPDESDNLFNPQYQKHLVEGISNGIDRYYTNNP